MIVFKEIVMKTKAPISNNINEWFQWAINRKAIKKIQFKELESDVENIKGGKGGGELAVAKYEKEQKRVVVKKVTTDGSCADRKQHFIYEASIKPLFLSQLM